MTQPRSLRHPVRQQTFHGEIIQGMRAVEAKRKGEADEASARRPLPLAELSDGRRRKESQSTG